MTYPSDQDMNLYMVNRVDPKTGEHFQSYLAVNDPPLLTYPEGYIRAVRFDIKNHWSETLTITFMEVTQDILDTYQSIPDFEINQFVSRMDRIFELYGIKMN